MFAIRFKTSLAAFVFAACLAASHTAVAQDCLKGDVNLDGSLNMSDVLPFGDVLRSEQYLCEADIGDGLVDFNDAGGIQQILLNQQGAAFTNTVTDGVGDFFWSTSNLNEGAVNGPIDLFLSPGESATLYLYYSTNGPSNTDIKAGYSVNVATSQNGIVQFNDAATLHHTFPFIGGSRWGFPRDNDGPDVTVGQAQSVSSDLIIGMTAINMLGGPGFSEAFSSIDPGYDSNAQAFLCGRVEIQAVAPGSIELLAGPNDLGIANEYDLLKSAFARANISVSVLLGDVNLDRRVDFLDIVSFVGVLASGTYQAEADLNQDTRVDFLDISPWVNNFLPAGN